MKPTLGQIVHYMMHTGEVRPALVVNVLGPDSINLQVFLDTDMTVWVSSVRFSGLYPWQYTSGILPDGGIRVSAAEFPVGTWRWPPRLS